MQIINLYPKKIEEFLSMHVSAYLDASIYLVFFFIFFLFFINLRMFKKKLFDRKMDVMMIFIFKEKKKSNVRLFNLFFY